MDFQTAVKRAIEHALDFKGRAPRAEYWYFILVTAVITIIAAAIDGAMNPEAGVLVEGVVYAITSLILFIPQLSVSMRRLHDVDKSGWWLFLILIPLVGVLIILYFFLKPGTPGQNDYGPNPLEETTSRYPQG